MSKSMQRALRVVVISVGTPGGQIWTDTELGSNNRAAQPGSARGDCRDGATGEVHDDCPDNSMTTVASGAAVVDVDVDGGTKVRFERHGRRRG